MAIPDDVHDPAAVAHRLTRGQRSAIRNLDVDFSILGCSEPYAKRMSLATTKRPSLVEVREAPSFCPRGPRVWEYSLSNFGARVKNVIEGVNIPLRHVGVYVV